MIMPFRKVQHGWVCFGWDVRGASRARSRWLWGRHRSSSVHWADLQYEWAKPEVHPERAGTDQEPTALPPACATRDQDTQQTSWTCRVVEHHSIGTTSGVNLSLVVQISLKTVNIWKYVTLCFNVSLQCL